MLWDDWEAPLPQSFLANTSMCADGGPGEDGEELCVLFAEGEEYVLDAR